jgi:methylglyoxal/glyoxal reductase
MTIPNITLNNGIEMPQLGLGVYEEGSHIEHTQRAVLAALECGYRHIDTAAVYRNEEEVGKALKQSTIPRKELFITTKVWDSDQGYESTLKEFDQSLEKLQMDYVDLYLVHWPVKATRKETWQALEYLYAQKRVRAIGVSNYLVPHLKELLTYAKVIPAVNQIEFTPFCNEKATLQFCREMGIALESYSPLVRGLKKDHPVLIAIAEKYDKSTFQVLIRWAIEQGVITIPKSNKSERITANASVFDFKLSHEEMIELGKLHDGTRVAFDPMTYF